MLCRRSDGGALEPHPSEKRGRPHRLIDPLVNWPDHGNRVAKCPTRLKRKFTATDEMYLGTWAVSLRQELRASDSR